KQRLLAEDLDFDIINLLIGRLIFSRFLFDRDIIDRCELKNHFGYDFEELIMDKNSLYSFFNYLKSRFNGNVFEIADGEIHKVNNRHLKILSNFFSGDDLENGQKVLFNLYDFSIIPVELISSIYESFLLEEKQQKEGIFYTPLSLVDYMLNDTVNKTLESKNECKVLDPACGSGIFLVESLRRIIEAEKNLSVMDENLSIERLTELVKNNIFGIDIDKNAVNISIFSIYLTMLDYIDDYDFKFPELVNTNFFVDDFFNESSNFNKINNFDVIVGNPPWVRVSGDKHLFEIYCKENNIPIRNRQISEAFLARANDFISDDGIIALIVSSKIFYNAQDIVFRRFLIENFNLLKIFDLSFVRKNLFKGANWPSTILFYKKIAIKNLENTVKHISSKPNYFSSIFKKIVVQKTDIKYIKQFELLKFDWLWKVSLVGNSLDFNFIKRLKSFNSLNKFIVDNNFKTGVGFKPLKTKSKVSHDAYKFKGIPFLRQKDLEKYSYNIKDKWEYDNYDSANETLITPPNILLKESTSSDFGAIAAFSNEKIIFDYHIMAINGNKKNIKTMKSIMAAINSKLFNYFAVMTSSIGIARNVISSREKFEFPISPELLNNDTISRMVEFVEHGKKFNTNEVNSIEEEINNMVFDIYNLDEIERDLIKYSSEVTIPLIKGQDIREITKSDLNDYVKIVYNHFKDTFSPKYFYVDVYTTKYFIGMNFKILDENTHQKSIFKENNDYEEVMDLLGFKTLDDLGEIFVQRDIKTFNENSFSIIKSKELKNWHKAVAWLDIGDIVKEMFFNYNSSNKEGYDE
ncbi:MAG: SAM-dependent methyltransferase, partial [Methanobrevibacter sp.]|nr:SAM-dependent methyltransferase [Candidatus Methanoflexus mossambicus]